MKRENTIYYAVVGIGDSPNEPVGIVRRTFTADGRLDEALRKELIWERDTAIIEWEYGNLVGELLEITETEAQALIEHFRQEWGAQQS